MKRVKGVEDLNICIIGTQGIVGVGAIIPMSIASCQAAAHRSTARAGSPVVLASSARLRSLPNPPPSPAGSTN